MKYSLTEKFIKKLLFESHKITNKDFKNLNYDTVIIIGSNHLLIPLIYVKLRELNCLKLVPGEFKSYLKNIYDLNYNRNKKLLNELEFIKKILTRNKIKHVFLKGSAMILGNYYKDIGERMINDIDFLFLEKDKEKLISVLIQNQFLQKNKSKFFINHEFRHLERFTNNEKIFAVEPHTYLVEERKKI